MVPRSIWRSAVPLFALLFSLGVNSRQPPLHVAHASLPLRASLPLHDGSPPYDAVYGTATHNSYWVERDRLTEKLAHGTQERLLDQLLHERVRAIELDVHFNDKRPGVFSVYHTDAPANSLCTPLDECLKQLMLFHYLEPEHDVVNVIVELKELWTHIFAREHSIADLDATLRRGLGATLYTPREFLARCPTGATMRDCARARGWPSIAELRGKFIVNVLGNFNYNANDWVDYATKDGGVVNRAGFPMRSILRDNGGGATGVVDEGVHDAFDAASLFAAREASIFWQVERLDYPELDDFLAGHGIIRGRKSETLDEQRDRIRRGFQLVMSDHPWHVVEDASPFPSAPFDAARRLRDPGALDGKPLWPAAALVEPGARLYAIAGEDEAAPLVATVDVDAPRAHWETAPSTTRTHTGSQARVRMWPPSVALEPFAGRARPRGLGCLRAASDREWFMICRQVVDGELARVSLRWHHDGDAAVTLHAFDSGARSAGLAGDLIALDVDDHDGRHCVRGASASELDGDRPAWHVLGGACFATALVHQGVAATRDVLFAGTRHDGAPVAAATLTVAGGTLLDLSGATSSRAR